MVCSPSIHALIDNSSDAGSICVTSLTARDVHGEVASKLESASELAGQDALKLARTSGQGGNVADVTIHNVGDMEFVGTTVVIGTAPEVTIADTNGAEELLQFQSDQVNPNGVFETLASMADDDAMMGGGGARKAICQVNADGDLEILETLAGDEGYPADFSEASKANGIYWKLTPVE